MGTSGEKQLFLNIIEALNKTDYNVIVVYSNILDKNNLPVTNDNILFKKFVPSTELLMKDIDLAIVHGGRGTIYTTAYSGKPAIGIPMFLEQQSNINNLVKHGAALRVSKKYFKEYEFLNAINKIFSNYNVYLNNAQILAKKLTRENGSKIAAQRLNEIIKLS
jgi:UDP:flavonoid glycosyltransferase YjiC (YdhE family)